MYLHLQDLAVVPLSPQEEDDETSSSESSEREGEEGGEAKMKTFPLRLPQSTRHKRRRVNIEELPCR